MRFPTVICIVTVLAIGCDSEGQQISDGDEGEFCSVDAADNPFYLCRQADDLVCVSSYAAVVADRDGGPPMRIPLFICHRRCQPGTACPGEQICCPSVLADGGVQHACVPKDRCDNLPRDR